MGSIAGICRPAKPARQPATKSATKPAGAAQAGLAKGQCTPGTDCQHGGQVVGTAKGVGNGVGEAVQKSMVAAAITAHMGEGGQRQGCSCGNGSGNQVFSFHSC